MAHVSYFLLLWSRSSHAQRVFGLRRCILRIIFKLGYREDVKSRFISKNLFTLPSLYIYTCVQLFLRTMYIYMRSVYGLRLGYQTKNLIRTQYTRMDHCFSRKTTIQKGGLHANATLEMNVTVEWNNGPFYFQIDINKKHDVLCVSTFIFSIES